MASRDSHGRPEAHMGPRFQNKTLNIVTVDGEDGSASVQAIISNPKNNTEFDARLAADQRAQLDRLMEQASDVQASTNETLNDPVYAEPRKESDGIVAKIARLRKKEQNLQSDISARFFGLA